MILSKSTLEGIILRLSQALPIHLYQTCLSYAELHGPVNGMNSINRTDSTCPFVISMKSSTSESLRPLTTTTFSFTETSAGDARAASKAFRTASWPLRRVMNSNLNGSKVSRLWTLRFHTRENAGLFLPYIEMS